MGVEFSVFLFWFLFCVKKASEINQMIMIAEPTSQKIYFVLFYKIVKFKASFEDHFIRESCSKWFETGVPWKSSGVKIVLDILLVKCY